MAKKKAIEMTRTQLIDEINKKLTGVITTNSIWPSIESYDDFAFLCESLPAEIMGKIHEFVGEDGINHICFSEIARYLGNKLKYTEPENEARISDLLTQEEVKELADLLLMKIEAIPEKIHFIIKLPRIFYKIKRGNETARQLSSSISIIFDKMHLINSYPVKAQSKFEGKFSGLGRILANLPIWEDDTAYLSVTIGGYCGVYGGKKTMGMYNEEIKSLLGIMFAQLGLTFRMPPEQNINNQMGIAFTVEGDTNKETCNFDLHSDIHSALNISIWRAWEELSGSHQLIVANKINASIDAIGKIYTEKEHNPKLGLSSQWFYDSLFSSNETMAFVQATTAIEVLLGDKKEAQKIGLGNLLSNRYAYLTGKNHKERSEKISTFKRLYELRCDIVHSGRKTLTTIDQKSLMKLRELVAETIVAEMR